MTSPIKAITHALSNPIDTLSSFASNAFSKATPNIDVPPPLPPAISPTGKPAKKGVQQSFLSGVAAAGLQPGGGSGSTGKTLLGA